MLAFIFLTINFLNFQIDSVADEAFFNSMQGQSFEFQTALNIDEISKESNACHEMLNQSCEKINGYVNPITGKCLFTEVDYIVPGPIPFTLERFNPQQEGRLAGFGTWFFHQHMVGYVDLNDEDSPIKIYEPSGELLSYTTTKRSWSMYKHPLKIASGCFSKGHTNLGYEEIGGINNKKNYLLKIPSDKEVILIQSDGTKRIYYPHMPQGKIWSIKSPQPLMLKQVILPSGHKVNYNRRMSQNDEPTLLVEILNPNQTKCFSSFEVVTASSKDSRKGLTITGPDGRKIYLDLEKVGSKLSAITKVIGRNGVDLKYEYDKTSCSVKRRYLPNGFCFESIQFRDQVKFDGKKFHKPKSNYKENNEDWLVACQKAFFGEDQENFFTSRFRYFVEKKSDKPCGYTEVLDAFDNLTRYYFNQNKRMTQVEYFIGNDQLHHSEHVIFSEDKNDSNFTNLLYRYSKDEKGNIHCLKQFIYDSRGNVLEEYLFGNITGLSTNSINIDKKNNVNTSAVEYSKKSYTYSNCEFNLKLSESSKEGVITYYSYLPGTNLPIRELVEDKGVIKERCFLKYDEDHLLIEKIIDDGSSTDCLDLSDVTERRILRYKRKQEAPNLGMPYIIEELYFDTKTKCEVLLYKRQQSYNLSSQIIKEDYFDGENKYCFSAEYEWDELGRMVSSTNPKGVKEFFEYDNCSNMVLRSPRPGLWYEYKYDKMGRLIEENENDAFNHTNIKKYTYNYLNQLIASECSLGSNELFEVDRFNNITKAVKCLVENSEGHLADIVTLKKFDAFNRLIEETDARGYKTKYSYTIEDKPITISYPDGTFQHFEYDLNGNLIRQIEKNGLITCIDYDYRDREIERRLYSSDGKLLKSFKTTYKGWRKICHEDCMGQVTNFGYDGAGRLISIKCQNQETIIEYDAFGEVYKKTIQDSTGDFITEVFIRNRFKDIVEEQVLTKEGLKKITFNTYDDYGNKINITEGVENATFKFNFDSFNQLIQKEDALGNVTQINYKKDYFNSLGQRVLKVDEIDPLKNCVSTIYDTLGRPNIIEVKDAGLNLLKKTIYRYDASSNLISSIFINFDGNKELDHLENRLFYGPLGRIEKMIEGINSHEESITLYLYNAFGQLSQKVDPQGICLSHEYDDIGRLKRLSSFGSYDVYPIDYLYFYDQRDLPVKIENLIDNTETLRQYDTQGRMICETLENGLTLRYDYDDLSRCRRLYLPDNSSVSYYYDGPYLNKVLRFNTFNQLTFTHTYRKRDLSGRVTHQQNDRFSTLFSYNPNGRLTIIDSPYFNETIEELDPLGNVLKLSSNGNNYEFSWDNLYQINEEKGVFNHKYHHDAMNNRLEVDGLKYENNVLNQTLFDGISSYVYDKSGNLRQFEGKSLTFDALNRLKQFVDQDSRCINYFYDAFNRRHTETCGDDTSYFLYQGNIEIGRVAQSGYIDEFKVLGFGFGADVGAAVLIEINGHSYIPSHDFKGNVRSLLDLNENIIKESYLVDSFGNIQIIDEKDQIISKSNLGMPWIFLSKRKDNESDFICFGRRFFNTQIGKWITKDPQGFEDGPNLYAFVHNNPQNCIDLFGLSSHSLTCDNRFANLSANQSPGIMDTVQNWFYQARLVIGTVVQFVGHEVPIPYIRLGIKAIGLIIERGAFVPINIEDLQESSDHFQVGHNQHQKYLVTFINGICNSRDSVNQTVKQISKENEDLLIDVIFNSSHGFVFDVLECVANMIGIPTHATEVFEENMIKFADEARATGRQILHIAHSQGGLITGRGLKNLSPEDKSIMHIRTYGSACIIPNGAAATVNNFVNLLDPVPWLADWPGMLMALNSNRAHLRIIDHPKKALLFDHMIMGESYRNHWRLNSKKFLES